MAAGASGRKLIALLQSHDYVISQFQFGELLAEPREVTAHSLRGQAGATGRRKTKSASRGAPPVCGGEEHDVWSQTGAGPQTAAGEIERRRLTPTASRRHRLNRFPVTFRAASEEWRRYASARARETPNACHVPFPATPVTSGPRQ